MDYSTYLAELRSKLTLLEVSEKYMTLTQRGGRYWGCCPFHHEKTASFAVNENGYFYCFGCKESGDMIKFVMQMEGTDFMGALEILAKMAGMPPPNFGGGRKDDGAEKRRYKDRLRALMRETALFYFANLKKESATVAREYLAKRGIDNAGVKRFGIGYSIDWDSLPKYLASRGYKNSEMVDAGVCDSKNGKIYDSLGGRLIIPIIDSFKNVVAFGGRVLEKTDFAKYKNTKETELFIKSRTLYGLNLVKETRKTRKVEELIIVEGYMDAISLYTAGYDNVVASMGTSLTQEQAKMMKFLVSKVYISYDGDFAGLKAAVRGLDILDSNGIDVKVAVMPEGLDPDDVIKKMGRSAYDEILARALPLVDFKLFILKKDVDLSDSIERRKYIQNALKVISKVRENATKSELCEKLAREVGVKYESLIADLRDISLGEQKKEQQQKLESAEANPDLKKEKLDEEKNFLLYMLISRGVEFERVKEVEEIFSPQEKEMITDFQSMKLPISNLFEYIGSSAYNILKFEEVENKEKFFSDVLKKQKQKIYDKKIVVAKAKLAIAKTNEEKQNLLKEINKYTKLKRM